MPENSTLPHAEVVTVGECLLRLASPAWQRLADASALDVHVAGAEANVAAALAQLGVATRWVSRLPDNVLGRRVERQLAGLGVLVDAIEWSADGRIGLFFSDTGVPPRPTTVTYDRAGSAFSRMTSVPAAALAATRRLHLTGITPALGIDAALDEALAHAGGAELSVDVNYRSMLWSPDEARAGVAPLLARASTVICAEADARTVFGCDGDPHEVLDELSESFAPDAREVVITRGEDGCIGRDGGGAHHEQPAVAATVVDRFGMGDAFVAGLLWGLLRDGDLPSAMRAGATLAALKATVAGDVSRTGEAELRAALHETRAMVR